MDNEALQEKVFERVLKQGEVELWPGGPTFSNLLEKFFEACAEHAHLDAWLPMASPKSGPVVAFFFQGATLRLADELIVHRKVATMAFVFAAIKYVFRDKDFSETSKMILGLPIPDLNGKNPVEGIHYLGALAIDEWLNAGLHSPPPTKQIQKFVELTDKFAVKEVLNPHGIGDALAKAFENAVRRSE